MQRIEFEGDGVRIVGDAAGPVDGVPVLFLHGGGQTRQSWGRAIEAAAERGYRAITLDLRGHGESGWAADGDYGIERFEADLRRVAAAQPRPPVLVGASMGGLTALLVAASPPPAIAALVLVDVAARLEPDGTREIAAFMTGGSAGFASPDEAADAVAAFLPHRTRPKSSAGLMRNLRLREDGRYHWHWDPAFIRVDRRAARDPALFEDAARRLAVPTLLVRGGRSRVLSPEGARAFQALAPHTELASVDGADHMVAGDANDSFNAVVFAFLSDRAPPAGAATGR